MSNNNVSFSVLAAAFHSAHIKKIKSFDGESFLTVTRSGDVTQTVNNVTAVTAHATKGKITMQTAVLSSATDLFEFNNRHITATSTILLTCSALTSSGDQLPSQCTLVSQEAGRCTIMVYNPDSAVQTDDPPVIHYLILD